MITYVYVYYVIILLKLSLENVRSLPLMPRKRPAEGSVAMWFYFASTIPPLTPYSLFFRKDEKASRMHFGKRRNMESI